MIITMIKTFINDGRDDDDVGEYGNINDRGGRDDKDEDVEDGADGSDSDGINNDDGAGDGVLSVDDNI